MHKGSPLVQKMKEHGKSIAIFGGFCAVAMVLSYQLKQRKDSGLGKKISAVELAFHQWKDSSDSDFSQLDKMLKKEKVIKACYEAKVGQELLKRSDAKHAQEYVQASFERVGSETLYHRKYAETSLLIAQKESLPALLEARKLKDELESVNNPNVKVLKGFNLLRIAMLEKEVGSQKAELEAWQRFEGIEPQVYRDIQEAFAAQKLALSDYIAERKKILKN